MVEFLDGNLLRVNVPEIMNFLKGTLVAKNITSHVEYYLDKSDKMTKLPKVDLCTKKMQDFKGEIILIFFKS